MARKQEPQSWLLSSVSWFEEMFVGGLLTDASGEQTHSGRRTGERGEVRTVSWTCTSISSSPYKEAPLSDP